MFWFVEDAFRTVTVGNSEGNRPMGPRDVFGLLVLWSGTNFGSGLREEIWSTQLIVEGLGDARDH